MTQCKQSESQKVIKCHGYSSGRKYILKVQKWHACTFWHRTWP